MSAVLTVTQLDRRTGRSAGVPGWAFRDADTFSGPPTRGERLLTLDEVTFVKQWLAITSEQKTDLRPDERFKCVRRYVELTGVGQGLENLVATQEDPDAALKVKKSTPPRPNGEIPDDADHYKLAVAFIEAIERAVGTRPVYSIGQLWRVHDRIWVPSSTDDLAAEIGRLFGGMKFCRRGGDFRSIAQLAATIAADERFFDDAPIGVAGPGSFWRVTDEGPRAEPLAAAHRQRMRMNAEPDFETEAPLWSRLLEHAFAEGAEGDRQRDLLQILFGAALSRSLWRYRIAALLFGATTTGKTTLLNVLASLFPRDLVGATNPQRWGNEYYLAGLAGKIINVVGELDPDQPIPGGAFKSVVGCDVIEGRHPTHRPFSFVSTAAHFINANRLPPTVDKSDAFFRRWRIVHFSRTVPEAEVIVDLADQIIEKEIGAVVAWMLEGATILSVTGEIPETEAHKRLVTKWRHSNNSALAFICDRSACEVDPTAEVKGATLFEAYRSWAASNGVTRPFGRNGFYEALDEGGARLGVVRLDPNEGSVIKGVRVVV